MPSRPSVYSCPIAEFEASYDRDTNAGKMLMPPNAHFRALRMLRLVAEAAHALGKAGADIARIELLTQFNPASIGDEMHVIIVPKWKLKEVIRITHPADGKAPSRTL
jgi:hypothetical protein